MVGLSIGSLPIQRMSNKQKPQKRPMRGRDWTLLASVDWSKQWKTLCLKNWNLQCRWRRACSSVQLFPGKFGNLVPHRVYCFFGNLSTITIDLEESWSNLNQIRFEIMSTSALRPSTRFGPGLCWARPCMYLQPPTTTRRMRGVEEVWEQRWHLLGREECCTVGAAIMILSRHLEFQSSLHFFQKIEKMQIMSSRIMSYFPESPTSSSFVQEILDLIGQDGWSLIEESSGIQRDINLQNFRHWFD